MTANARGLGESFSEGRKRAMSHHTETTMARLQLEQSIARVGAETGGDAETPVSSAVADAVVAAVIAALELKLRPPRNALDLLEATHNAGKAWPFLSETLAKHPEARVLLDKVAVVGVGRRLDLAFVRLSLLQRNLHVWIRALVADRTAPAAFYEPFALMRDKEAMAKVAAAIESTVSPCNFQFVFRPESSSPSPTASTLPNPAPLVSALSAAASTNASHIASTAFELGMQTKTLASGLGAQTKTLASSAFGFGFQSLTAAKETLDNHISSLAKKPSIASGLSVVNGPANGPPLTPDQGAATSDASPSMGTGTGVMTSGLVSSSSTNPSTTSATADVASILRELDIARKHLAEEREAKQNLQEQIASLKVASDRVVAGLHSEIMALKRQVESAKHSFQDISDI
ncbi:hypothetical protein BC830DRAFT_1171544 [Chytriomyces sp. MP71]|nr:hypothetical protein BC830DRAFT_1171544 [Chytriomyces sp. MP71]